MAEAVARGGGEEEDGEEEERERTHGTCCLVGRQQMSEHRMGEWAGATHMPHMLRTLPHFLLLVRPYFGPSQKKRINGFVFFSGYHAMEVVNIIIPLNLNILSEKVQYNNRGISCVKDGVM